MLFTIVTAGQALPGKQMFSVQTANTFPSKSGIQALMSPDLQRSWSIPSLHLSRSGYIDEE